jgi:hypothetical protein
MDELKRNVDLLHTTEMGAGRIKRNIKLETADVVGWCRLAILQSDDIVRRGKNWYVRTGKVLITVNARSYTLITAHPTE